MMRQGGLRYQWNMTKDGNKRRCLLYIQVSELLLRGSLELGVIL